MHWGGQELRIVEQTQWLNDHGHPTWIIARAGSAILNKAREKSLPVFELAIRGSINLATLRNLTRFLRSKAIDLLDCHGNRDGYYGAYVRWLSRLPIVRSRHVIDPIRRDWVNRFVWKYGNDLVIVTAEMIRDNLVRDRLNQADRIFVSAAGVDEKRFHPGVDGIPLRRRIGIPEHHFVVANIGMIRRDKGQLQFVQASRALLLDHADMTCIQIGEAPSHSVAYKKRVIDAAGEDLKKERIRFLGYHDDIENWMALADVVVIASIATEARTRLVAQAFLMKKNVIATDTGGLPEMVNHDRTGLICTANDPDAIRLAVNRLINDRSLAEDLRECAYRHALRCMTFDHMMAGILNAYHRAIVSAKKM